MSHVATINIEVKDLKALIAAGQDCGLEFVEGQKTFKWWGRHVGDWPLPEGFTKQDMGKCEHVLRVMGNSGAYEVGITRRRDGKPGYVLLWDFFAGGKGLQDKVGEDGKRLIQEYAKHVAKKHLRKLARMRGARIVEKREGGRIILTMAK